VGRYQRILFARAPGVVTRSAFLIGLCLSFSGCDRFRDFLGNTSGFCSSTSETQNRFMGSSQADHLVIFVHGFCGDAKNTWFNKESTFDFPTELAKDLKDSYILSFNYVSRLGGGSSIVYVADQLAFEIGELFKVHRYQSISFVTHSTGGIVVREYILRRQPRSQPQARITHVILLAVPNTGTEVADLNVLVPTNRQPSELRQVDNGNSYLESLNKDWNQDFKASNHPRNVLVYAGFEQVPLEGYSKVVVTSSSSIAYADQEMAFQKNHFGMSKPTDRQDFLYRWVKSQLEVPFDSEMQQKARDRIIFDVKRARQLGRGLDLVVNLPSIIGRDLEYFELDADAGQGKKESYRGASRFLKEIMLPLFKCVGRARSEKADLEGVKYEVKPIALALEQLLREERKAAHDSFVRSIGMHSKEIRKLLARPGECETFALDRWPESLPVLPRLIEGPYIHLATAHLLLFSGDLDRAVKLLEGESAKFGWDMNFNNYLAGLENVALRDLEYVIKYYDAALKIARVAAGKVAQSEQGSGKVSREKLMRMKARFNSAIQGLKNNLAFALAQDGSRERDARIYAEEGFLLAPNDAATIDTQAYVKMAFGARKAPPDLDEIRDAKALFEKALSYAESLVDGDDKSDALQIVEQHLRQSEELLSRRQ
jgi:pimeloyl-ACP methyl ester carboxylesterase